MAVTLREDAVLPFNTCELRPGAIDIKQLDTTKVVIWIIAAAAPWAAIIAAARLLTAALS